MASESVDSVARVQQVLRDVVAPIAKRFAFEDAPSDGEVAGAPCVLVLGNHSSGKSSFINHLLGKTVQRTGLAPTDDAFTILAHGSPENDVDGQALTTDPSLPWSGLRVFGPELLTHLRLKRRDSEILKSVTLIDSPGLIDAAKPDSERGFDFAGVVRFLAARADLVILFFDPDKPGTTGEALSIVTQSLRGIDHKLLIVMNKMDLFKSLSDFARCYGALCWNLGKVIARKDLPFVFTTYFPVENAVPPALPADEFVKAREALVREVVDAKTRRADNRVTQLQEYVERLQLHATIIRHARTHVRGLLMRSFVSSMGLALLLGLATWFTFAVDAAWWVRAITALGAGLAAVHGLSTNKRMKSAAQHDVAARIPELFERVFARELLTRASGDELRARFDAAAPRAQKALQTLGARAFPRFTAADEARLRDVVSREIPALRRAVNG